ncbi:hypothetical protein B0H13DRAFT_1045153 [Mycena leptocephala]|nr:hypothetical protein B0H13DRAFT_1045153 [Mycena leptocephala]
MSLPMGLTRAHGHGGAETGLDLCSHRSRPRSRPRPPHCRAPLISASSSRHRAIACACGPGCPQWTSSVRSIGVEVGAYAGHPFLAAVCALAFLVLTDAEKSTRTCTRDLDRTLGAGARTRRWRRWGWRVRVRVRVRGLPPRTGAGFAPPLLDAYEHTSLRDGGQGCRIGRTNVSAPLKLTLRASAARANDAALLSLEGTPSPR